MTKVRVHREGWFTIDKPENANFHYVQGTPTGSYDLYISEEAAMNGGWYVKTEKQHLFEPTHSFEIQAQSKQQKLDKTFINIANEVGQLSHCIRSKVGAVIVNKGNIISFGYNGTPAGMDNCCEENNVTLPHVIHAESNAILKAAKSGYAVEGSTLYLTLSPCQDCCKLILQSGIKRVVYRDKYRDTAGIDFLKQFITVEQYKD
jgi:dCMP deaminase